MFPHRIARWLRAPAVTVVLLATPGVIQAQDANLRVLVFDIAGGRDAEGLGNLARVGAIIRETNADIVLLQAVEKETRRAWDIDQVHVLSEITGLHGAFHAMGEAAEGEVGMAVLSRWPIVQDSAAADSAHHEHEPAGPAGVLALEIERPGGRLRALGIRIDTASTDEQVAETLRQLQAAVAANGAPAIMGGSFNAIPGSPAITGLTAAGWTDAWAQCGSEEPAAPRVQYLFLGSGLRCLEARLIETDASPMPPLLVLVGQA